MNKSMSVSSGAPVISLQHNRAYLQQHVA